MLQARQAPTGAGGETPAGAGVAAAADEPAASGLPLRGAAASPSSLGPGAQPRRSGRHHPMESPELTAETLQVSTPGALHLD